MTVYCMVDYFDSFAWLNGEGGDMVDMMREYVISRMWTEGKGQT